MTGFIEGEYEEILYYMNREMSGIGVQYSESHGIIVDEDDWGPRRRVNFGLFAVCEDYRSEDSFSPAVAEMSFDPKKLEQTLREWDTTTRLLFPRERNE